MPRYKFLGTPDLETITLRDVVFDKGKTVEVTDANFCAKLSALDYFAEVKAGRPKKHDQDGD